MTVHPTKELERLKNLYTQNEVAYFKSLIEVTMNKHACVEKKRQRPELTKDFDLKKETEIMKKNAKNAQKTLVALTRQTVPQLCAQIAPLRASAALYGDYNLKILRQREYLQKQDLIIQYLLQQHSRLKIFSSLLLRETRFHQTAVQHVSEVHQMLSSFARNSGARVRFLTEHRELFENEQTPDSLVFHKFTQCLSVLVTGMPSSPQLANQIEDFLEEFEQTEKEMAELITEREEVWEQKKKYLNGLKGLLYGKESANPLHDERVLVPEQIQTHKLQVERQLQVVVENLEDIVQFRDQKLQSLQEPSVAIEKNFFLLKAQHPELFTKNQEYE